jgi:hypothetical protein
MFGENGARSISNLRMMSAAYRDTAARLNNTRSGVVANWGNFFRTFGAGGTVGAVTTLATGVVPGLAVGATLTAGETVARNLSARAMMSQDLSRWLRVGPRQTTPQAIRRHIGRLTGIAQRNPAIQQEVLGLQNALRSFANDNAPQLGRAAASDDPRQQQQEGELQNAPIMQPR